MTRIHCLFVASLFVLLTTSPAAGKIRTAQDPDVDFGALRTYAWLPKADPDDLVSPSIRWAADEVLQKKGLRKVEPGDEPKMWMEFAVGSADSLRAGWILTIGWWGDLWGVPGARSRVEAGLVLVASLNGGEGGENRPIWGGKIIKAGNNPDALMVMAANVDKTTKKIMKRFPAGR